MRVTSLRNRWLCWPNRVSRSGLARLASWLTCEGGDVLTNRHVRTNRFAAGDCGSRTLEVVTIFHTIQYIILYLLKTRRHAWGFRLHEFIGTSILWILYWFFS